jgi:hypothetical protein
MTFFSKRITDMITLPMKKGSSDLAAVPDPNKSMSLPVLSSPQAHRVQSFEDRAEKQVQFVSQPNTVFARFYDDEDLKNAWLSDEDHAISRRVILLEIQSHVFFDITFRGLEHFQNATMRNQKMHQDSNSRKSICLAAKEIDGDTVASMLSCTLSASDVKRAHEIAIVDACIAKYIHGVLSTSNGSCSQTKSCTDHRAMATETTSTKFTYRVPLVGKYGLFSHRRQTKRKHSHYEEFRHHMKKSKQANPNYWNYALAIELPSI